MDQTKDGINSKLDDLVQKKNWDGVPMYQIQGFWCPDFVLEPLASFQKNFIAHDTDIVLASLPKSGTTWLKSILFSIVNRKNFALHHSPVLTNNPHKLFSSFEFVHYAKNDNPDLENMTCPRLFSTHLPCQALASSLIRSKSKIVYVARNPLDQFVSDRHFLLRNRKTPHAEPLPVEAAFDMFVEGVHSFGPSWDHVLGYWNASLENPDNVLFLTYEDMKRDPVSNVRRIAEFLRMPFSEEEEDEVLLLEISKLCGFQNLKNLETNKNDGRNSTFFRKGETGDWKNHLTPDMAERMERVMDAKLSGSGLMLIKDAYCRCSH